MKSNWLPVAGTGVLWVWSRRVWRGATKREGKVSLVVAGEGVWETTWEGREQRWFEPLSRRSVPDPKFDQNR